MYQRTVLIVEDEPLIRMILADSLEDEDYAVVEAATALEAIGLLGTRTIDLVITDIDMPAGLNGLDVARYVTSCKKEVPVIVTSGGHVIDDGELVGNARFIAKPYDFRAVFDMMVEMGSCGHRNPTREIRVA
jgi:DNA-binding NtrC family response regulator